MAEQPVVKCSFCGTVARAKVKWRGSSYISRLLWLSLLFPGPIYNYWQWRGRRQVCSQCGSEYISPVKEPDDRIPHRDMKEMEAAEPFLSSPRPPQDPNQF